MTENATQTTKKPRRVRPLRRKNPDSLRSRTIAFLRMYPNSTNQQIGQSLNISAGEVAVMTARLFKAELVRRRQVPSTHKYHRYTWQYWLRESER